MSEFVNQVEVQQAEAQQSQAPAQYVPLTLANLATQHKAGKAIIKALSERERYRKRTDLNRLFKLVNKIDSSVSTESFMDFFKNLKQLGAGRIIIGRYGNPNRFDWKYNYKDTARAAVEGKDLSDLNPIHKAKAVVTTKKRRRRSKRQPTILSAAPTKVVQAASKPVQTAAGLSTINIALTIPTKDVQAFLQSLQK